VKQSIDRASIAAQRSLLMRYNFTPMLILLPAMHPRFDEIDGIQVSHTLPDDDVLVNDAGEIIPFLLARCPRIFFGKK